MPLALAGMGLLLVGLTLATPLDEPLDRDDPRVWHDPASAARAARLVVSRVLASPLGTPSGLARTGSLDSGCTAFRGSSGRDYCLLDREEYWVERCSVPWLSGTLESYAYLLADSTRPTVERVRWVAKPGSPLDLGAVRRAQVALGAALRERGDVVPGAPPEPPFSWTSRILTAGFELFAGPEDYLRLGFAPGVVVWHDSVLVLERWSRGLLAEEAIAESAFSMASAGRRFGRMGLPAGTLEALSGRWPGLERALSRMPRRLDDVDQVGHALDALAADPGASARERDLVLYAATHWIWAFDDTSDSTVARRLESTLGPRGVAGYWGHYDGWWHVSGSLLRTRANGARSNPWADRAFLYFQETGWEGETGDTVETFRVVIERGERFLRAHPRSTEWAAVARTVALAHELAWSLSKVAPEDEYVDPKRYAGEAPGHRRRAIELYEHILGAGPLDRAARRDMRQRLERLRLDVDTATRTYAPSDC